MNTQQKIEEIRKWVITSIHGCEYEEALEREVQINPTITIGRVMAAMRNKGQHLLIDCVNEEKGVNYVELYDSYDYSVWWQLINPDGSEASLEDQSEETIDKLLELLKS